MKPKRDGSVTKKRATMGVGGGSATGDRGARGGLDDIAWYLNQVVMINLAT
jgi:hypothetical protein